MPSPTDFNLSPYYDDFTESKKFHRVLFRPAFAVQARELTQSQTILQNQIERVGDHLFKQGAMVIPGQVSIDTDYFAVKLTSKSAASLSTYNGTTITGGTSGVIAEVITSGAATQILTPGVIGWNNDSTPSTNTYVKVVNKESSAYPIQVTLHYLKLED